MHLLIREVLYRLRIRPYGDFAPDDPAAPFIADVITNPTIGPVKLVARGTPVITAGTLKDLFDTPVMYENTAACFVNNKTTVIHHCDSSEVVGYTRQNITTLFTGNLHHRLDMDPITVCFLTGEGQRLPRDLREWPNSLARLHFVTRSPVAKVIDELVRGRAFEDDIRKLRKVNFDLPAARRYNLVEEVKQRNQDLEIDAIFSLDH